MRLEFKSRFNLGCFFSKKAFLMFVSLIFMVVLIFSPFVSVFCGEVSFFVQGAETPNKVVKNESELVNAISVAPSGKSSYVIGLSADVTLKSFLGIPSDKNIVLVSVGGVWNIFGANKQNTITVDGLLTLDGIGVTHTSGDTGGGVFVKNGGALTLLSGKISGNTGTNDLNGDTIGGGVFIDGEGSFVMSGGEISGNTAFILGGGVCNRGTFTLSGGEISGNTAGSGGGGVANSGVFVMSGGKISSNTAPIGGGVATTSSTFTMSGGEITCNTAGQCGGVFYTQDSFEWIGGVISGNTAGSGGNDVGNMAKSGTSKRVDSDFGVKSDGEVEVDPAEKISPHLFLLIIVMVVGVIVGLLFL